MNHRHPRTTGALLTALVASIAAAPAAATSLPNRTVRTSIAPDGSPADGASSQPVLSPSGRVLAFSSTATNIAGSDPDGAVADVFTIDLATNERRLVSEGPAETGADGASSSPVLARQGARVAFASEATNLVEGDTNLATDVFLRDAGGPLIRVSVGADGAQGDGPSYQPDLSADGRYVAFTSEATNLVPGDTNGRPDVFVRDLDRGTTIRVSVSSAGAEGNARSSSPSLSADGRTVAFESGATNLVGRDLNGVSDVFVRDLRRSDTERVSVSSAEKSQDKSVARGFLQVPDVSDDGRYVVFDSDATRLTPQDRNERTDVFLRDRKKGTTQLISASSLQVQGDNDSFAPRITPDGRFVTFQSFAQNLAVGDGPREDVFLRDLEQRTTSVVNVTASGAPRLGELVPQLLQRPALSADARLVAFSSTVPNLVAGDGDALEDVFVRFLAAPAGRVTARPKPDTKGTVRVEADDPLATSFVCQVDEQDPFACGRDIPVTRGMGRRLRVRVGGPGMQFAPDRQSVVLSTDRTGPTVHIAGLSKARRGLGPPLRVLRGTARDPVGVKTVEVALTYLGPGGCFVLATRTRIKHGSCTAKVFLRADGGRSWRLRLPRAVRGPVAIYARGIDRLGNRGKVVVLKGLSL